MISSLTGAADVCHKKYRSKVLLVVLRLPIVRILLLDVYSTLLLQYTYTYSNSAATRAGRAVAAEGLCIEKAPPGVHMYVVSTYCSTRRERTLYSVATRRLRAPSFCERKLTEQRHVRRRAGYILL